MKLPTATSDSTQELRNVSLVRQRSGDRSRRDSHLGKQRNPVRERSEMRESLASQGNRIMGEKPISISFPSSSSRPSSFPLSSPISILPPILPRPRPSIDPIRPPRQPMHIRPLRHPLSTSIRAAAPAPRSRSAFSTILPVHRRGLGRRVPLRRRVPLWRRGPPLRRRVMPLRGRTRPRRRWGGRRRSCGSGMPSGAGVVVRPAAGVTRSGRVAPGIGAFLPAV